MSTYLGYWQEKAEEKSNKSSAGKLIVMRLTPYGWDNHAYLTREEAVPASRKFEVTEEIKIHGDDGPEEVIRLYLAARAELASKAVELVPQASIVTFPEDLTESRCKTEEEAIMDEAMLQVELEEYDCAEAILARLRSERDSLFAKTIARRIAQNRSANLPATQVEEKRKWMRIAADHAQQIIDMTAGKDLYQVASYGFGGDYKSTLSIVARAATTVGDYLLNYENAPHQALEALQAGEDTSHGDSWLYELKVQALLQLDSKMEAFAIHQRQRLHMEEVTSCPDYQAYLLGEADAKAKQEAARMAAIRISTVPGTPAPQAEIDRLVRKFGPLPEDCAQWIRQHASSELHVEDDGSTEEYRFFTPEEALEKHDELMEWLHLHDSTAPEMSEELFAIIRESGIDPDMMLPIAGNDQTPDCFLLRLDGEDRGHVYFWGHDERASFEVITNHIKDLFPYLERSAKAGQTFVL